MKNPKNYRHKTKCKFCGEFIPKHNCKRKRWKENKFRCGDCRKYLPKKSFPKDKTKKYGIMCLCKKCRSKRGNGNNNRKLIKEIINKLEKLK